MPFFTHYLIIYIHIYICILVQDALVKSLINRFKEFQRPKKPRNAVCTAPTLTSKKGKAPGITNSVKSPVPAPGEDAVSYERHVKYLKVEYKKANRNWAIVGDLMERSFALRRQEILENTVSIEHILVRFPFLHEADQVHT